MATVVNVAAIKPLLLELGWDGLNITEALGEIRAAGISPVAVLVYLKAVAASQEGCDDQMIDGCPPEVASVVTAYLSSKGVIASSEAA